MEAHRTCGGSGRDGQRVWRGIVIAVAVVSVLAMGLRPAAAQGPTTGPQVQVRPSAATGGVAFMGRCARAREGW